MEVFPGSSQATQLAIIDVVNAIFTSVAVTDNAGNPFVVVVKAANAEVEPSEAQILVDVQEGPEEMFDSGELVSFDGGTKLIKHFSWYPDTRVIFTIDASKDQERRFMVSYLRWGILSAYTVDQVSGIRMEGYLMNYLASLGIHRRRNKPLFDRPNYNPVDLAGPRPQGQVFSATLDMWVNVESLWFTPPFGTVGVVANIQQADANLNPTNPIQNTIIIPAP